VVGTNPFIIGSEGGEGNRFRDLINDLDVDCFVLNTGRVGREDIGVEETVTLLRNIARGSLDWERDGTTGLTLPTDVPEMDMDKLDLAKALPDAESTLEELRSERERYLAQFDDLDSAIQNALY
jgi:phosphoenolpyruvate carboxykinase (ATP)